MEYNIQHFPAPDSQTIHHFDTIHHVEFDFYGKRLATTSSDKVVCIWDRTPNGWVRSAYWKKHGAAVWKARFAHPEYGQILATCSLDNTVQIFDKDTVEHSELFSHTSFHIGRNDTSNGWSRRATLTGSTSNILDIQFAPYYLGLRLAACTAAGKIMIWDADDIMALENWNNTFNLDACPHRLSSLTWSINRFNPPLLVASSEDTNADSAEKIVVFMFNNSGYSISKTTKKSFDFADQVSCVAFGPSLGLTYHKLAIAAGNKIHVYHLQAQTDDSEQSAAALPQQRGNEFELIKLSHLILGEAITQFSTLQVVRISWNIFGDVISAVYGDGIVRLWKFAFSNKWVLVSEINPPNEVDHNKDTVYY